MTSITDLLNEDARRRGTSYPPPTVAKDAPAPARCYGDIVRERAAAEGRIGYHVQPISRQSYLDKRRREDRAAESERIAEWIERAAPGWPTVVKIDWLLDELPEGVLDEGSSLNRSRVIFARMMVAAGWSKIRGYGGLVASYHWARDADVVQFNAMSGHERSAALREAVAVWDQPV